MAEYILRDLAGDRFEAFSAGIKPAGQIHPLTFHILKKNFNINARRARSKTWDEFLNRKFDLVFTLCRKDRETCPYWEGQSQLTHRDITDPEADNTDDLRRLMFIAVAKEIRDRLKEFCRPLDPKIAPYRVLPRSSKQSPPPPEVIHYIFPGDDIFTPLTLTRGRKSRNA